MTGDVGGDGDDRVARNRRTAQEVFDRLFAPDPSSEELAARNARRLAEQSQRLDWAALEQMRAAVADPVDCALETLRPLTLKLGVVPVPSDTSVWVELGRIIDGATCTRDPRCDYCDKRSEWGYW
ncbi:MAG TPA: hypothetical protein VHI95_08280 [Acidimicrobiales bacterium]|jgi:hypothetical protein|nr:hypothetical protein [Acidimicrobiales bacterium]